MRTFVLFLLALVCWPIGAWTSLRARRRLRAYSASERGALTLERVA
jgi:hypothetical protein